MKNFILIFLVLLSVFNYNTGAYHPDMGVKKEQIEIPNRSSSGVTIRLPDKKSLSKKDLKDEIKRRKKYHKSLVATYNENFSEEYLSLIAKNSEQLTILRRALES